MNAYNIFFVLLVFVFISSCEIDEVEGGYEAIVIEQVNTGITVCNMDVFQLKFIKGEEKIKSLFDYEFNVSDSIYSGLNLPEKFKNTGTIIKLDIRAATSNERPACYEGLMPLMVDPVLYIIQVEKK